MDMLVKLLTVAGLGAMELWAAIPAGLALQLHPLAVGVVAAIGAMFGVLVVLTVSEGLRRWLVRRHGGAGNKQHGRLYRIWARYGVVGLGLLAPLLVGAPLGTVLGMALGAPKGHLLLFMSLGIAFWSGILTLLGALSVAGLETLMH